MSELVPFRFEVPEENLARASRRSMRRIDALVSEALGAPLGGSVLVHGAIAPDGASIMRVADWRSLTVVYTGRLPQPAVTALQALAMGHDVDAVLDLLEDAPRA